MIISPVKHLALKYVPDVYKRQPQLDLGVVRVHQHIALLRHEQAANLAAQLGAGGDVLQIRLRGAETVSYTHLRH